MRLDKFLQTEFNLTSRTYAENLILTHKVTVNGKLASKPSLSISEEDEIRIINDDNYASQGAYKLEEAFSVFNSLSVSGKQCVDVGCSNGGFTDVLLRRGAGNVLAIDVAECALPVRIKEDKRVEFLRANARELPSNLDECFDFACCDVSFISLKLILPSIFKLLKEGGESIVLIKPQFELGRSALSKDGIVLKEKDRQTAVKDLTDFAVFCGFKVNGVAPSPVIYEHKNREFLLYLTK